MERDGIAYTFIMLFTLYFNLYIFSAAAEYFSSSKSHLDNEDGISEQPQIYLTRVFNAGRTDRSNQIIHKQIVLHTLILLNMLL